MSRKPIISLNFSDCPPQFENFFLPILEEKYSIRRGERPDFLVYALTGHRHRLYNCVKIYVHHETYPPNWKECDYAILPIWSPDPRQLHVPIFAFDRPPDPLIRGQIDWDSVFRSKTRFCALLSSYADRSVVRRIRFFEALNQRRKVDSVGRAVNNCGFAGIPGHEAKFEFYRPYRFIISFENKERLGWTTEKMYDPLAVHAIPIFWGDRNASKYFNPDSFINAHDFQSHDELADYVCHVDRTPDLYKKYLRATPFRDNLPPEEFSRERVLHFFEKIFAARIKPVTQKRWFFGLTKWRLAKRNKLSTE
jgi:hypothetical protein